MSGAAAGEVLILAIETSCDDTAAAVVESGSSGARVLSSVVSSQIEAHRPFGGVVPELASRRHIENLRPVTDRAFAEAGVRLADIGAFAATAGPGLASSLVVGSTFAKALALARSAPFFSVNHLEGHLLSPFLGAPGAEIPPHVGLIVSGGHTMLVDVRRPGHYRILGQTRDDAAGEAFDKAAKLLGLPYPGGPAIEKLARDGRPDAVRFPRSMLEGTPRDNLEFSFSGLKTALRYTLVPPGAAVAPAISPARLADLCASYQEAVVDVLTEKTIRAARIVGASAIAVSGGVSCNRRLRSRLADRAAAENLALHLAAPAHTTDNAAMIGFAAAVRLAGSAVPDPLDSDINPNLPLAL